MSLINKITNVLSNSIITALAAGLLGLPVWMEYLHGSLLFYFTIILGPLILYVRQHGHASIRFSVASAICLSGYLILGMNILFLAGYLFFLLFLIEWKVGKLNNLSVYWIFLLSPLTIFMFSVFSFPIRLKLSETAAYLLSFLSDDAFCQGNMILINGSDFSVDEACMGLSMVGYSYLIILVLISYFEKLSKKEIGRIVIILIMCIGTFLILFANLMRILTIVFMRAMPGTAGHEIIGVLSWIIYVILPSYFMIRFSVGKLGAKPKTYKQKILPENLTSMITLILVLLIAVGSYQTYTKDKITAKSDIGFELKGFDREITENGVIKFKNKEALIYIKPSCPPYRAGHSPDICWKGSGYRFFKESVETIFGINMMNAELKKESDKLYTVWWYDNGKNNTESQVEWRWQSLKGSGGYHLINITTEKKELLDKYVGIVVSELR